MPKGRGVKVKRLFLSLILCSVALLHSKTWVREYTYNASEADSKLTSRAISLEQVKRLLLQEIGVYVHSTILNEEVEVSDELKELTAKQIEIISAGITETKIIEENWNGDTYYIKAEITADENDVIKRLDNVIEDKEKTKQLEDSRKRTEEALTEIERLKQQLTQTKDENEKLKLQKEYNKSSNELTAEDWFQKGYHEMKLQNNSKAINYFIKALSLNPTSYKTLVDIGIVYSRIDQTLKAAESFSKAISVNPKRSEAYMYFGMYYESLKNHDMAIKYFEKVISLDSLNFNAYKKIGKIYEDNKNYNMATEYYGKLISLDSLNYPVYEKIIKIHTDNKNYNMAIKYMKELAANCSNRIDVIYYLAMYYYRIGLSCDRGDNYMDAKKYYQKAIDVDSLFVDIYIKKCNYAKESTNKEEQLFTGNEVDFICFVESSYYEMGIVNDKEGNYKEAVKIFTKLIKINPDHYPAYWKMGISYGKQGNIEKELQCYTEAIKIEPDFADPYYNMDLAYEKKGDFEKAMDYYYKACEVDIFFNDAAENYLHLKQMLEDKKEK